MGICKLLIPPPILHNTKWSPLWAETNMYVSIVFMADGCSGSQEDIYIINNKCGFASEPIHCAYNTPGTVYCCLLYTIVMLPVLTGK